MTDIEYRKGDLFTTDIDILLHGCNSKGVMGSGIAKSIKTLYPEAYEKYTLWCANGFRLGQYLPVLTKGKTIINAVTQQNYGKVATQTGPNPIRYVSYDAISEIMYDINISYRGFKIAMPLIGCSLGGGRWPIVAAIIESELTDVQPVVYTQ